MKLMLAQLISVWPVAAVLAPVIGGSVVLSLLPIEDDARE